MNEVALVQREYSKYSLLDIIYEAKRAYYKGKPTMTDIAFDHVEASFVAIHGTDTKAEWILPGYDPEHHKNIKQQRKVANTAFLELWGGTYV